MKNVKTTVSGTKLIIEVDLLQSLGPSKSGKSTNIGSTFGNVPVPGTDVVLSVNCYKPNPKD